MTLVLRWRVPGSGEEVLVLLVTFDSTPGRSVPRMVGLDEIDFCTACGFTEGGRETEIEEVVVPGTVLFSTRWFDLNGEGARNERADLGALGEVCGVLRILMLALEFILAFGRTEGDGEGDLVGDCERTGTFGRGEIPFALMGDGGRALSSLAVTWVKVG